MNNIFKLEVLGPQLQVGGPSGLLDFVLRALRALKLCDPRTVASRTDALCTDASHTDASHTDASRTDASHTDATHTYASHTDASHTDASHTYASSFLDVLAPLDF